MSPNSFASSSDNLLENLATLDQIVASYPPLDKIYQDIRSLNQDRYRHRSKANLPKIDTFAEQENTENLNFLVPASCEPLTEMSQEIVSTDSANLLQKFKQIVGKWRKS